MCSEKTSPFPFSPLFLPSFLSFYFSEAPIPLSTFCLPLLSHLSLACADFFLSVAENADGDLRSAKGEETEKTTDELDEECDDGANKLPHDAHDPDSPPAPTSIVPKPAEKGGKGGHIAAVCFEDGDPAAPSRSNSMLLQLTGCSGNLAAPKTKPASPSLVARSRTEDLHRKAMEEAEKGDEAAMIRCMLENPRFGNMQSEEKEYYEHRRVNEQRQNWRWSTEELQLI